MFSNISLGPTPVEARNRCLKLRGAQTYDERLGHCKAPGVRSADELFGIGAGPPLNRLPKP